MNLAKHNNNTHNNITHNNNAHNNNSQVLHSNRNRFRINTKLNSLRVKVYALFIHLMRYFRLLSNEIQCKVILSKLYKTDHFISPLLITSSESELMMHFRLLDFSPYFL